jgi:hypothetical protein
MSAPILMPFQDLPFNGDTFVCREFLKIKEKLGITVAVETGSCMYSTTEWLGQNFDRVHTAELNAEFAQHGVHKISGMANVQPEIKDSVVFLKDLMNRLGKQDRVLYFLDAHWGHHCPLMEEITALLSSPTELPPVIAIHDWYTGDERLGWDEYNGQRFEYSWIEPKIKELEKAHGCIYTHYYNTESENGLRGLIYLIPVKSWVSQIANIDKWNKYSQSGEEAFVDFILNNLPKKGNHLVEIGAWDGFHLSNTRFLIERGYTHLLIDGDNRGNEEVKEHFILENNILEILEKYNTPEEFDLLCIDIDGNDLYILEKILGKYNPSLLVAEYNPIFQPNESKVITYDENHRWNDDDYYGFSFLAGLRMAEKHGYACVHENDSLNMYFVRKEFLEVVPNISYKPTNYHRRSEKHSWIDY